LLALSNVSLRIQVELITIYNFSVLFEQSDDKTRVPVGENEGYINASYICMKVGTEELFYISAQGPLPGTQDNFWQMVWENKSDVIAMMTQEVERGRVKCHKYWPEKLDVPKETSRYQLFLDNYQMLGYFHIKVIKMVEKEVRSLYLMEILHLNQNIFFLF